MGIILFVSLSSLPVIFTVVEVLKIYTIQLAWPLFLYVIYLKKGTVLFDGVILSTTSPFVDKFLKHGLFPFVVFHLEVLIPIAKFYVHNVFFFRGCLSIILFYSLLFDVLNGSDSIIFYSYSFLYEKLNLIANDILSFVEVFRNKLSVYFFGNGYSLPKNLCYSNFKYNVVDIDSPKTFFYSKNGVVEFVSSKQGNHFFLEKIICHKK